MVCHAWASSSVDLRHRLVTRPAEITKTSQVYDPHRKIDILALMQQLDPEAPVRLEARDLVGALICDRRLISKNEPAYAGERCAQVGGWKRAGNLRSCL